MTRDVSTLDDTKASIFSGDSRDSATYLMIADGMPKATTSITSPLMVVDIR